MGGLGSRRDTHTNPESDVRFRMIMIEMSLRHVVSCHWMLLVDLRCSQDG